MGERLTEEEVHDIGRRAGIFLGMVTSEMTVARLFCRARAALAKGDSK